MDQKAFLQYLFTKKSLTQESIQECLQKSRETQQPLAQVLIQNQFLTAKELKQYLAEFRSQHQTLLVPIEDVGSDTVGSALENPESIQPTLVFSKSAGEEHTFSASATWVQSPLPQKAATLSFGKYEVVAPLGKGGMGMVYKVRHRDLDQYYALKVIQSDSQASAEMISRFHLEAKTSAKLRHPGIVQVFDSGQERNQHYFVMEYVEGQTLEQMIRRSIPQKEGLRIVQKALESLHYAHQQGVIHRDLKPENIFVTVDGVPKIGDFGLAKDLNLGSNSQKITLDGTIIGTPSYMPPEQVSGRNEKLGATSDIYSMGVCLYQVLTGVCPFEGKTIHETFYKIISDEPRPPSKLKPSVSRELDAITLKAIHKMKSKRYSSALEFAEDIGRFLRKEPILAKPPKAKEQARRWLTKHKLLLLFISSLILFMVFGLYYTQWRVETESQRLSEQNFRKEQQQKFQRFETWIRQAQRGLLEEKEKIYAIAEITQMSEEAIFQKCLDYLKEGTAYFLKTERDATQSQFYKFIVEILGKFGRIDAGKDFLLALSPLKEQEQKEPAGDRMQFLITLIRELARLQVPNASVFVAQMREDFAQNSLFMTETFEPYQKLLTLDQKETSLESSSLLEKAKHLVQKTNQYQEAIQMLSQFLLREPENAEAYYYRGIAYYHLQQFDPAIQNYSEAIRFHYKNLYAVYHDRGACYFLRNQFEPALEDLNKSLQQNASYVKAYHLRGSILAKMGKLDQAIQSFKQGLEFNPKKVDMLEELCTALFMKQEYSEVQKQCQNAVALGIDNSNIYNLEGLALFQLRQFDASLQAFNKSIEKNPKNFYPYQNRALVYLENKDFEKMIENSHIGLKLKPNSFEFLLWRGRGYQELQKRSEALQDYLQAMKTNANNTTLLSYLGQLYVELGEYSKGLQILDQTIQANFKTVDVYYWRGVAKYNLKKPQEAVKDLGLALALNPNHLNSYWKRSAIYYELQQFAPSLDDYTKIIQLEPSSSLAYHERGLCELQLQQYENALNDFNMALKLDPSYSNVYNSRGILFLHTQRNEEAIQDFTEGLKRTPNVPIFYVNRGSAYHNLGKREQAKNDFVVFLELTQQDQSASTQANRQSIFQLFPELKK